MAGKQFLSLLCLCLLVPYTLTSPVTDILRKKHTQLAILAVIGLDEIVTRGALLAGLTGLMGVSAGPSCDPDSRPCSGYSHRTRRTVGGWCRPVCFGHEVSAGSCGRYRCCIPNNL